MKIEKQLGMRISYLRKKMGLSQLDLALEAGINRNYLSDLERGMRNPTLSVLNKLAKALKINLSTLLLGIEDFN